MAKKKKAKKKVRHVEKAIFHKVKVVHASPLAETNKHLVHLEIEGAPLPPNGTPEENHEGWVEWVRNLFR